MRDPFANYDAWLERPYQDQCDREAAQEWIEEHTIVTCGECGKELGHPDNVELKDQNPEPHVSFQSVFCPFCNKETEADINIPDLPENDDYEPPDRD